MTGIISTSNCDSFAHDGVGMGADKSLNPAPIQLGCFSSAHLILISEQASQDRFAFIQISKLSLINPCNPCLEDLIRTESDHVSCWLACVKC